MALLIRTAPLYVCVPVVEILAERMMERLAVNVREPTPVLDRVSSTVMSPFVTPLFTITSLPEFKYPVITLLLMVAVPVTVIVTGFVPEVLQLVPEVPV